MPIDTKLSSRNVSGETVMRFSIARSILVWLAATWSVAASAQTADLVLMNGKIVTVDDRFTIAQALAVKGERVIAVGSNADIEKLKGPATRVMAQVQAQHDGTGQLSLARA
jgi:hypothetical protein